MDPAIDPPGEEEEALNVSGGANENDAEGEETEAPAPPEVQRRIKALKNIQLQVTKMEANFYEEMHALECKYLSLYQPFFEQRSKITSGEYEPTDEECDFPYPSEQDELAESVAKIELEAKDVAAEPVKGIPDFWLKIFKQVEIMDGMIEPHDEPVLKHLVDIKTEMSTNPMGFKLHFHFSPNAYFTNPILTKSYSMKCELDTDEPFQFEGPEIVSSTGCHIEWAKGKNITLKTIRKKQKHKQRGSVRTVSKTVEADSFFNFFNPPQVPDDTEELDEATQLKLTTDFEIGQYIRERIIPRAVLFYTGEALDDDEYEMEEEDEDDEDEEDEDEEGGLP